MLLAVWVSPASDGFHVNDISQSPKDSLAATVSLSGLELFPASLLRIRMHNCRRTGLLVTLVHGSNSRSNTKRPEFCNMTKSLTTSLSRESSDIHGSPGMAVSRT